MTQFNKILQFQNLNKKVTTRGVSDAYFRGNWSLFLLQLTLLNCDNVRKLKDGNLVDM